MEGNSSAYTTYAVLKDKAGEGIVLLPCVGNVPI
jgi:hypothetical protein